MLTMRDCFLRAVVAYPKSVKANQSRWQLIDGEELSGMVEHRGKLILQEKRQGCRTPFNHWGYFARADDIQRANGIRNSY